MDIYNLEFSTTKLHIKEKPLIVVNPEDKFETLLSLPENEQRRGEGGLRARGYFKKSLPEKPLITIITVVFNGEKYLEETIQSVINQNYDNVEYIIIDGGSSDSTINIIKKYDHAIDYWISEKDDGIYDAMNKGISLAQGILIGLINADDLYASEEVFKSVISVFNEKKADIIVGNMDLINTDSKALIEHRTVNLKKMYFGMYLNHPSAFVSLAIYKKIGLFDTTFKMAADYNFMLKNIVEGTFFSYIPETLAIMRDGGASIKGMTITLSETKRVRKEILPWHLFKLTNFIKAVVKLIK